MEIFIKVLADKMSLAFGRKSRWLVGSKHHGCGSKGFLLNRNTVFFSFNGVLFSFFVFVFCPLYVCFYLLPGFACKPKHVCFIVLLVLCLTTYHLSLLGRRLVPSQF